MKRLLYICLLLITVTVSANNVKVTEDFVRIDKTSIAIEKLQWYNNYYRESGKGVEMPYAMFKVKIKKGAILAKKIFSLDLGGSYMVKETDTEHDNEIWFLVPYQAVNVMLKCGDGCEPVYLFQGKLKPNAVYEGEVIFDDSDYHANEFGSVRWSGNRGLLRKGSILIYNEDGDSLYNGMFDQSKVSYLRYQVGKVYTYEIRCPQFKTITDTFVVADKDQIKDIKIDSMSPNYNFLFVKSTQYKLTYTIDNDTTTFVCNHDAGNAHEGGLHVLHFKAPDYMPKDTIINLSGDASIVKLDIRLTKESGMLYVKTNPSEAHIQIDGVAQGKTPYTHTLSIGQHKIHIVKSGYADFDTIVTIKKDKTTQLQLELNANVKVNFKSSVAMKIRTNSEISENEKGETLPTLNTQNQNRLKSEKVLSEPKAKLRVSLKKSLEIGNKKYDSINLESRIQESETTKINVVPLVLPTIKYLGRPKKGLLAFTHF